MKHSARIVSFIVYGSIVLLMAVYCYLRPLYNWDALPYGYIVLSMQGRSAGSAHREVYKTLDRQVPPLPARALADSSNKYRWKMAADPEAFRAQLPFYTVKPLYLLTIYLSFVAGLPLFDAVHLASVVAFAGIAILLIIGMKKFTSAWVAATISLCLVLSPPFIEAAKLSSPDALSALFLLLGMNALAGARHRTSMVVFFALAILTRPDNLIAAMILCAFEWKSLRLTRASFTAIMLVFFSCYACDSFFAWKGGWSPFFYPDFARRLHPSYGGPAAFSGGAYLKLMYEHFLSGLNQSFVAVFLLVALLNYVPGWR
ncbi:MAG TPA: hypothetical protein VGC95_09310, partial [Chitinophagaceae bacterium]